MANKIQFRRGLKANLPALSIGEPALCTDNDDFYIGGTSSNIKIAKASDLADNAYVLKNVFGINYLSSFYKKVMAGTATKVVFSGDSTTQGFSVVHPENYIDQLFLSAALSDGFSNISVVNRGQGGKDTNDWVTTYLAGDLSENPDVLILRWGINDPFYGRNLAQFTQSLRDGLTTIRASRPLNSLAIVLMTPSSVSDTPNGRDASWMESVSPIIRKAARDFNCCFIDTYAFFQDSINAGDWMDSPFGDARHIHPVDVGNYFITSIIYDTVIPTMLRVKCGFKQARTLTAINYYVDPIGGSDLNTGTIGAKFKTTQHAIDILPLGIDHLVNIFISPGTTTEVLSNNGFTGKGNIIITGGSNSTDATNYKIKSLNMHNVMVPITINGLEATEAAGAAFSIYNTQWTAIVGCRSTSSGSHGIASSSSLCFVANCLFSNKFAVGIAADYLSTVLSSGNTGTSNLVGIRADNASTLGKSGLQPSGTTAEASSAGGVVR